MLSTDLIIHNILIDEKRNGNTLLQHFHIQYPSKRVSEESNSIFIACVSAENNMDGFDFNTFTDLVEVLIVTKNLQYDKAIMLIKTLSSEVCRLIMKNQDRFPNKPQIRTINPEFNKDFVLTRGHIMVQCETAPVDYDIDEETYKICEVLLNEIDVD